MSLFLSQMCLLRRELLYKSFIIESFSEKDCFASAFTKLELHRNYCVTSIFSVLISAIALYKFIYSDLLRCLSNEVGMLMDAASF